MSISRLSHKSVPLQGELRLQAQGALFEACFRFLDRSGINRIK